MESKEQLLKELRELTVKSVEINNDMGKLLPRPADVSSGEKMKGFFITEELIAKYEELEKRRDDVESKKREIWIKLRGF